MESTKTQKMVLAAMLAALGMILNLIEIPYPFAPWLNLDLSEIVVLCSNFNFRIYTSVVCLYL